MSFFKSRERLVQSHFRLNHGGVPQNCRVCGGLWAELTAEINAASDQAKANLLMDARVEALLDPANGKAFEYARQDLVNSACAFQRAERGE